LKENDDEVDVGDFKQMDDGEDTDVEMDDDVDINGIFL
jgi:hypothetical protein